MPLSPKGVRKFLEPVPQRWTPDERAAIKHINLESSLKQENIPIMDRPKAVQQAEQAADQHLGDIKEYGTWPFTPMGVVEEVVRSTGSQRAGRAAMERMMTTAMDNGKLVDTRGGITGRKPSYTHEGLFSAGFDENNPQMGHSWNTSVTKTTPWAIADSITGDPDHTDMVLTRMGHRNQQDSDLSTDMSDKPAVYHLGDLERQLKRPVYVFRDMGDGYDTTQSHGFFDPLSRSIVHNRTADPNIIGDFEDPDGFFRAMLNVGQHEGVHAIKDGTIPSRNFLASGLLRPAVMNTKGLQGARYLGGNGRELSNLIWHTKRLTEAIEPGMRDVGRDFKDAENWLDYIQHYQKTGADPAITRPEHPNLGRPAHGYENQIEMLQEILRKTDADGKQDLKRMTHDLGATTPLRESLLA